MTGVALLDGGDQRRGEVPVAIIPSGRRSCVSVTACAPAGSSVSHVGRTIVQGNPLARNARSASRWPPSWFIGWRAP